MDIPTWLSSSANAFPGAVIWVREGAVALFESGWCLGCFLPGETVVLLLAATFEKLWGVFPFFGGLAVVAASGHGCHMTCSRRAGFVPWAGIRIPGIGCLLCGVRPLPAPCVVHSLSVCSMPSHQLRRKSP